MGMANIADVNIHLFYVEFSSPSSSYHCCFCFFLLLLFHMHFGLVRPFRSQVATKGKIVVEKSTVPVRTAHAVATVLANNDKGLKFQVSLGILPLSIVSFLLSELCWVAYFQFPSSLL